LARQGFTSSIGGLEDQAIGDCLPFPYISGRFTAQQKYLFAFFGEKSSLAPVLRPKASRYGANMYLCAGEISDTLIRHMAIDAAADQLKRPLVVFTFSDFDPAGMQMPVSIAWKLMAMRFTEFPSLRFKIVPVSLTLGQVLEHRLPTTVVKEGEKRQRAYGRALYEAGLIDDPETAAQVEIDALAALRPDALADITEAAIEGVYFDATLRNRTTLAEANWETQAREAITRQINEDDFAEVKSDAEEALEELKDAIADLRACKDRLDELTANIELPELPDAPEPEVDETEQQPLADSDWSLVECRAPCAPQSLQRRGGRLVNRLRAALRAWLARLSDPRAKRQPVYGWLVPSQRKRRSDG
jgi:hypothetical protein